MTEFLRALIDELDTFGESYEISRWQLKVQTYLQHTFESEVYKTFSELSCTDNVWDDSAKQKGYLEAFYESIRMVERRSEESSIVPGDVESQIKTLVHSTSKSIQPLRERYKNRKNIDFDNEYDYQDYMHSMLIPWFKDIRPEVPHY